MKARLHTSQNISRFYLSPYVEYLTDGGRMIFRSDLFNQVVITPELKTDADLFVQKLLEGMAEAEILNLFKESFISGNPEELLAGLMQKGILE